MSKSRILQFLLAVFGVLVLTGLYFGITGVVTLKEENRQLKVENTKIKRDNSLLDTEIRSLSKSIESQKEDIELLVNKVDSQRKDYLELVKKNSKLKEENSELEKDLKKERKRATTLSKVPSRGKPSGGKSFYVEATAYTALCNEGCTGITATGINLLKNRSAKVIAVDPRVIPLGTKVYVEGYGYAVAGDTGGAIKGYKVDLHVPNESTARQWGRKKVKLTILK